MLASASLLALPTTFIMLIVQGCFGLLNRIAPPLNLFSLKNLSLKDMAAASGIANSVKQLSGSIGIAMLTAIMTSRTSYHAARESLSSAETFVGGITDDFGVVCLITLASLLPFLLMLVKRRTGRTGTDVSK